MENLNKQNYFTPEWKAKYPLASEHFCKWIDGYKKRVGWKKLFNGGVMYEFYGGSETFTHKTEAPKFHDLPIEMQIGIIYQWSVEIDLMPYTLTLIPNRHPYKLKDLTVKMNRFFNDLEANLAA